jgi:single-stranded DNA-binding protein
MKRGVNKFVVSGPIIKEPEFNMTKRGLMGTLTLVTSDFEIDNNGKEKEVPEYHEIKTLDKFFIDLWKKEAEKNQFVYVECQKRTCRWIDSKGVKKSKVEYLLENGKGDFQFMGYRISKTQKKSLLEASLKPSATNQTQPEGELVEVSLSIDALNS